MYFLERGREKERERNINVWLPLLHPQPGTWPATQACALTGNWTSDPLVRRPAGRPSIHWATPARAKNILFWNKYRFTGSCKDRMERLCVSFTRFTTMVTSNTLHESQETGSDTRSVYSSTPFYHAQIRITTMAIKIQSYSQWGALPYFSFFNVLSIWLYNT